MNKRTSWNCLAVNVLSMFFCSHRVYSDLIIGIGAMTFRLVKRSSDFVSVCKPELPEQSVYRSLGIESHLKQPVCTFVCLFSLSGNCSRYVGQENVYNGDQNVSATGRPCLQWSTFPTYAAFSYSFYLHGAENFCRDPYPQRGRLWCIIGPTVEDWEYCNVSNCEQGNALIQACWNAYHFSEKRLFEINIIRWTLWKQSDQLNFAAF